GPPFWSPMGAGKSEDGKWVATMCGLCPVGPDPIRVHVNSQGIADRVEGNPSFRGRHPSDGKCCLKPMGFIEKTYNPNRVKAPMKRTNPRKGRNQDPGWQEIGWDEALDLVAAKLREVRAKGPADENGMLRVAASYAAAGTGDIHGGTWFAFFAAWGGVDPLPGGGAVKCYHSEHVFGELWHNAFLCFDDTPNTKFIIQFGRSLNASAGVQGLTRYADARARGAKLVKIEPHLSVDGAKADEWIPIKPKTDPAFLYGMLNSVVWEIASFDEPFLKEMTNAPYLIGEDGYYARGEDGKPLIWDARAGEARAFDAAGIGDFALEGTYEVNGKRLTTAFTLFKEHMKLYTPEWAATICDVPAGTIRRLAREWVENAQIGSTMEVEGQILPYRPVCVNLGKSVNNGLGAYQAVWASHMLSVLVGGLEVPGGHLSGGVRLLEAPVLAPTMGPRKPGPDGFPARPVSPTEEGKWQWPPNRRNLSTSLFPFSSFMGPSHLAWRSFVDPPEGWPKANPPEVLFTHRTNPALSQYNTEIVERALTKIPFQVSFAYTFDETSHFADVLLPERTDIEALQLCLMGGPNKAHRGNEPYVGVHLKQPAVTPYDTMDITDIFTELADRTGMLERYNQMVNMIMIRDGRGQPSADFALNSDKKHSVEEVTEAQCRAATNGMFGLDWFKENGAFFMPYPRLQTYHYLEMRQKKLRYELPYQGRVKQVGDQLRQRIQEQGLQFWEPKLEDHGGLPACEDYSKRYETGPEYDLWLIPTRAIQYAFAMNAMLPATMEVSEHVMGLPQIQMNIATARSKGIKTGDRIVVESPWGKMEGEAFCREGIRPDCLVVTAHFGHWRTPYARDKKWPNMSTLEPNNIELTDAEGASSESVRVRAYKAR
ncbi:MAG TPA: molybdopterin-dependent oxidoreductase, partial [Dehalococcoidia bacterium]|nr:molybdopterin-dependent oxidoreductase [Dehalococcoidia bacterium]